LHLKSTTSRILFDLSLSGSSFWFWNKNSASRLLIYYTIRDTFQIIKALQALGDAFGNIFPQFKGRG